MKAILTRIASHAYELANLQPLLALFLGAALLAVFLTVLFRVRSKTTTEATPSLLWTLYYQTNRFSWAILLAVLLVGALAVLRNYLHQSVATFQGKHGRVTQANYNAVQTIWGSEKSK